MLTTARAFIPPSQVANFQNIFDSKKMSGQLFASEGSEPANFLTGSLYICSFLFQITFKFNRKSFFGVSRKWFWSYCNESNLKLKLQLNWSKSCQSILLIFSIFYWNWALCIFSNKYTLNKSEKKLENVDAFIMSLAWNKIIDEYLLNISNNLDNFIILFSFIIHMLQFWTFRIIYRFFVFIFFMIANK